MIAIAFIGWSICGFILGVVIMIWVANSSIRLW